MSRSRITLVAATAIASAALLAACTAPAPEPEPTTAASVGGDIPDLRFSAPAPEPVETTAPAPAPTELPEGYGIVLDDTGVLSVVLPDEWTDVDGRPFATSDGREWASIIASGNAETYPSDWATAGLEFSGTAIGQELAPDVTQAFLTDIASPFGEACEAIATGQAYDDGLYKGLYSSFGNCGDAGTFGIAVVAQDPEFNHFVFLRGKFVSDTDKDVTFDQIFTTFQSTQGLDKASTDDRVLVPVD